MKNQSSKEIYEEYQRKAHVQIKRYNELKELVPNWTFPKAFLLAARMTCLRDVWKDIYEKSRIS